MVRNCQMAPKKPEANAPPSRAKDQNAILRSSNKKNRQHPPPTSRHWSVLTLHPVMSLFDIRSTTSSSIYGIIRSSREAIPIQKLKTITTNRLSLVEEDPRYVELLVSIYSPPEDQDEKNTDFKVVMPQTWSPKMYLGALNQSIRTNRLLSLESINLCGRNYTTINELNWLFPLKKEIIHMRLVTSASYLHLYGGEFQNKIP
jgi:hypothetical protein